MTVTRELADRGGVERRARRHARSASTAVEDLAVHRAHVGGVQRPVEAQDEQPGHRRGVGAGDDGRRSSIGGRLQLGEPDAVELDDHEQQGEHHADEHGGEQAEAQARWRR